jgi:hypothetical protein
LARHGHSRAAHSFDGSFFRSFFLIHPSIYLSIIPPGLPVFFLQQHPTVGIYGSRKGNWDWIQLGPSSFSSSILLFAVHSLTGVDQIDLCIQSSSGPLRRLACAAASKCRPKYHCLLVEPHLGTQDRCMRPPATIAVRPSNDHLSPPHTSLVALSVRAALLYWHWHYCVKVAVVGPQVSLDSVSSISLYCTCLSTPLQHVLAPPYARSCIPLFHLTPSMFRANLARRFLDG